MSGVLGTGSGSAFVEACADGGGGSADGMGSVDDATAYGVNLTKKSALASIR